MIKALKFSLFFLLVCFYSASFGQNVPVDFEFNGNGAWWSWRVFENGQNPPLEVVANPDTSGINKSPWVAKFLAQANGAPFAGCETKHGSDIGSFTIDQSNMIIRIMVYKSNISDVGIKLVRSDNWSLGEIKVMNTKINEWEQLTFDFSSHFGLTYDQLVVFPDFSGRFSENIIYFDNIFDVEYVAPPEEPPTLADATLTLPNVFSPNGDGVNDFYSPKFTNADWIDWSVYSRYGQLLFKTKSLTEKWNGWNFNKPLPDGVYYIVAECGSDETGNVVKKRSSIHLVK
tara:strand:- start:867 stop:1727 length:861 start_codon:yes stop_codon:yes gene_type:complete